MDGGEWCDTIEINMKKKYWERNLTDTEQFYCRTCGSRVRFIKDLTQFENCYACMLHSSTAKYVKKIPEY